ncbi:MAG: [protein-PII] uridylyltransferase [Deltaproteobacteria bacterium]|nr:[protein-PII] uridylyltransferase [Deltaproteobacteria bacterium]
MFHSALLETLHEKKAGLTPAVKDYLSVCWAELRGIHIASKKGFPLCSAYTFVIDDLIKTLFSIKSGELRLADDVAFVALGGYGRAELNIRSDIDLMLLYKGRITAKVEDLTQQLLYILWDTGLDMGFSIRSIDECLTLAGQDLKTLTALLDRRLLMGGSGLYCALSEAIEKRLLSRAGGDKFVKAKLDERKERHEKYGGSVYMLEPNIKEGEGGLRDMHSALWVIKALGGKAGGPLASGLLSERERATLLDSVDFLLWVRNEIHFAAGRKTDQLSFDHQEKAATLLGFEKTEHALAVEAFMRQYYMHASNISHYTGLMISRALHPASLRPARAWPSRKSEADEFYQLSAGMLSLRDPDARINDPVRAVKAFELAQRHGRELDQTIRDRILLYLETAGGELTTSKEAARTFMDILRGKDIFRTLTMMHSIKFLNRFIPEFAEICCRVQHDLYHIYTVDIHTLFAIREIERLKGRYKYDHSLLSNILEELKNPEVLYLALLFHDIGKARGKGHAEKGAGMAAEICSRLGIAEDDANTVRFLVKFHLLLADTAQYRDMHDERLIIDFARTVGDIERLNLLYLLTFADVRAVGPDVWNQWKAALFQELYFKALTVLERGTFEPEDAASKVERTRLKVCEILAPEAVGKEEIDEYFALLPHKYFLSNPASRIASHLMMLREASGRPYLMRARQDTEREYTELVITTHDVHGLFSMIAGVMAANNIDILGAQINTLKNGVVLDILQVVSPAGALIEDERKLEKIEADLSDVITGRVKVAALVRRRKPSILDSRPKPKVPARVHFDNEVSDYCTVLDIHAQNRIGLLYDITSTLARNGIYIHIAKISTKGEEAADIFYIKDIFGQKIFYKEKLAQAAIELKGIISGPAQPPPSPP